jgi:cell wall-associated NlpC family hydrolase
VAAGLVLLVTVLAAPPTAADEIAEKLAEAARVARALEDQGEEVSVLTEELNEARLRADQTAGQVASIRGQLQETDRLVRAARSRVRGHAVVSYMRGGRVPVEQLLSMRSVDELALRRIYVDVVIGNEQDLIGDLAEARELREARRSELEAAQNASRQLLSALEARRRAAAQAADAQEATLARVRGDLGELVEAERRRRADEEDRRSREELNRRQAAVSQNPQRAPTLLAPVTGRVPAPLSGASAAVAEAKRQIGKPYRWGAAGPDAFDCSGLTLWAWKAGGRSLPHGSRAQYAATVRVPLSEIQPGDLTFYGSPIHHMGIYVGGGQMVEASQTGTPVRYRSIYRRDMVGVGRVT